MTLVYNSDSYVVVLITPDGEAEGGTPGEDQAPSRGGYEIVDKSARKGIFLGGAVARHFREGVQALAEGEDPSTEEIDEFIAGYTLLAHQPLTMH